MKQNKTEETTKRLKCPNPNCGYTWNYKGNADFFTSCPNCRANVKVNQTPNKNTQENKTQTEYKEK